MISLGNSAAISQGIGPGTGAAGTITAGGEDSKGFSPPAVIVPAAPVPGPIP